MPNFDLTQLNSLITTNGENPISTSSTDMPIVNGKKYPYTKKGKAQAKKASIKKKKKKKKKY